MQKRLWCAAVAIVKVVERETHRLPTRGVCSDLRVDLHLEPTVAQTRTQRGPEIWLKRPALHACSHNVELGRPPRRTDRHIACDLGALDCVFDRSGDFELRGR